MKQPRSLLASIFGGPRAGAQSRAADEFIQHNPPIVDAISRGELEEVRSLIQQGADVNQPMRDGTTSLTYACAVGDLQIAELLIKSGAEVNLTHREDGLTPLIATCLINHAGIAKLLIKNGANVNQEMKDGRSPIHLAVTQGAHEVVPLIERRQQLEFKLQELRLEDSRNSVDLEAGARVGAEAGVEVGVSESRGVARKFRIDLQQVLDPTFSKALEGARSHQAELGLGDFSGVQLGSSSGSQGFSSQGESPRSGSESPRGREKFDQLRAGGGHSQDTPAQGNTPNNGQPARRSLNVGGFATTTNTVSGAHALNLGAGRGGSGQGQN